MHAREAGTSQMNLKPILLVIDEWTKLLRDLDPVEVELVVNTILDTAEAWANFEGYALVAGHEWTARESGSKKGAAIRRAFHAAYVHRIDEDYAKFLLTGAKGRKQAKTAPNLPTGHAHYQDSEGELDYMIIPYYGSDKAAIYEVAKMMMALSCPTKPLLVNAVNGSGKWETPVEMPRKRLVEPTQHTSPVIYTQLPPNIENWAEIEDTGVNDELVNASALEQLVLRMHQQGIPLGKIAYAVGMNGRHYGKFQELCRKLQIAPSQIGEGL
jgi:hypothetical protein